MELQQITDLRAEADELHRLLTGLPDADWQRATLFKQWTLNDIIQHLADGDAMGLAAATDTATFAAFRAQRQARRATGLTNVQETRERFADLTGQDLLAHWRAQLATLCDTLASKPLDARLPWAGPDMGVRMFTTARQMETWAHGQAIYDVLGIARPAAAPRLRNIAEIGVRTFAWAYRNRGLEVPADIVHVRLDTPFDATWEWHAPELENAVTGDAIAFCQVVTQVRNAADTALSITGATAQHWMTIVQCFAGPPETPPPPGMRVRQARLGPEAR